MTDLVCEYCGWDKGKTENSLRAHVNLHCKENPNRKQKPILESEGAGHKPEAPVTDKDAEIARLKAELDKIKTETGIGEPKDVLEFENGARYERVGECVDCGTPLYLCKTHPLRDDGAVGNRIAVYVVGARPPAPMPGEEGIRPEPSTLYCQVHDPTRPLRYHGKQRNPGEPLDETHWRELSVSL